MPTPSQVKVDHSEPWKENGNVVLAAQGKYFRVHRSVLSTYSEVFKDMFDCISPNEIKDVFIEQCPVVHLQDAATDVQTILKAMYDRSYPVSYHERMPISVVSAFLHLGRKYDIPALTKEATAMLYCGLDPVFNSAEAAASFTMPPCTIELFPGITGGDPHNFQVMNLLQEMGIKAPLPITMYQCIMTCSLQNVVDGYRANGSFYSLSVANLRSFVLMKNILENHRVCLVESLYRSSICMHRSCKQNIHQLWSEDIDGGLLGCWRNWQWDDLFCEACRLRLRAIRNVEMKEAWSQMPTAFGFSSWSEVKESGDFLPVCTTFVP